MTYFWSYLRGMHVCAHACVCVWEKTACEADHAAFRYRLGSWIIFRKIIGPEEEFHGHSPCRLKCNVIGKHFECWDYHRSVDYHQIWLFKAHLCDGWPWTSHLIPWSLHFKIVNQRWQYLNRKLWIGTYWELNWS